MNTRTTLIVAAAFAAVCLAQQANAQSCDAMFTDLKNWFQTQPNGPGKYWVSFTMVTNRADGLYTGYAEGASGSNAELDYYPAYTIGQWYFPAHLQGDTKEYFSDRRYYPPGSAVSAPFDAFNTGQTHINITMPNIGNSYVTITMPWGGTYSFTPSCQNGLMYGFSAGDYTGFLMSLVKDYAPTPR